MGYASDSYSLRQAPCIHHPYHELSWQRNWRRLCYLPHEFPQWASQSSTVPSVYLRLDADLDKDLI